MAGPRAYVGLVRVPRAAGRRGREGKFYPFFIILRIFFCVYMNATIMRLDPVGSPPRQTVALASSLDSHRNHGALRRLSDRCRAFHRYPLAPPKTCRCPDCRHPMNAPAETCLTLPAPHQQYWAVRAVQLRVRLTTARPILPLPGPPPPIPTFSVPLSPSPSPPSQPPESPLDPHSRADQLHLPPPPPRLMLLLANPHD